MKYLLKNSRWLITIGILIALLSFNPDQNDHRSRVTDIGCASYPVFCPVIVLGGYALIGYKDYSLFSVGYVDLPGKTEPVAVSFGIAGFIFGRDFTVSPIWK